MLCVVATTFPKSELGFDNNMHGVQVHEAVNKQNGHSVASAWLYVSGVSFIRHVCQGLMIGTMIPSALAMA